MQRMSRWLCSWLLAAALGILGLFATVSEARAQTGPGHVAIADFRGETVVPESAIENRFFLKAERFELTPIFGYVPNDPFVKRYVGGLLFGYHFDERFKAEDDRTTAISSMVVVMSIALMAAVG